MIQFENITKKYGGVEVVKSVSFSVELGSVVGLVGPNGAGKTTLIKTALGLLRASAGKVTFDGEKYSDLSSPANVVGAVLGGNVGYPRRKVRKHLDCWVKASGVKEPGRVDELLKEVGLEEAASKSVRSLSLGMGQRLALAEALAARPKFLLLDEPFIGLDVDGIRWLRNLIQDLAERHEVGVLLSNHQMAEMASLADELVVVNQGVVVANGSVKSLLDESELSSRALFYSADPKRIANVLKANQVSCVTVPIGVEVNSKEEQERAVAALKAAGEETIDLRELPPSLEDLYVKLTNTKTGRVPSEIQS